MYTFIIVTIVSFTFISSIATIGMHESSDEKRRRRMDAALHVGLIIVKAHDSVTDLARDPIISIALG